VLANECVGADCCLVAGGDDFTIDEDVVSVGNVESGVDVVIGDEDADAFFCEPLDDVLKFFDGNGVDSGERFIEKNKVRLGGHGAGDFYATAFTAGKDSAHAVADFFDVQFVAEAIDAFVLDFFTQSTCFENEANVIFDRKAAENA